MTIDTEIIKTLNDIAATLNPYQHVPALRKQLDRITALLEKIEATK